jgi:hypothetical protein
MIEKNTVEFPKLKASQGKGVLSFFLASLKNKQNIFFKT